MTTQSKTKTAIVILSDPASGSDEALGRLFNALAAAHDLARREQEVQVLFQGAGTRWAAPLAEPAHPAHALYQAVADRVAGASAACSDVFGARAEAERHGMRLLGDNAVPGTAGLPSLAHYLAQGYTVLTF